MACDEWGQRISAFADDALEYEQQIGLFSHLAGCARCRIFFTSVKKIKAAAIADKISFPPELDDRVFSAISQHKTGPGKKSMQTASFWRRSLPVPVPLAYALGLSFLFLTGLISWQVSHEARIVVPNIMRPVKVVSCYEMPEIEILSPELNARGSEAVPSAAWKDIAAKAALVVPGQNQRPPQPVNIAELAYPEMLLQQRAGGRISFIVQVDEQGRIGNIHLVDPSVEQSEFAKSALTVVQRLRFEPALLQGKPCKAWCKFTIFFKSDQTEIWQTINKIFA